MRNKENICPSHLAEDREMAQLALPYFLAMRKELNFHVNNRHAFWAFLTDLLATNLHAQEASDPTTCRHREAREVGSSPRTYIATTIMGYSRVDHFTETLGKFKKK